MKKCSVFLSLLLCAAFLLCACGDVGTVPPVETDINDSEQSQDNDPELDVPEITPTTVNVAALKGPTSIGLIKMIDEAVDFQTVGDVTYICDYSIEPSADTVTPGLIKGQIDIAALPANLASVLYNKTEGEIVVLNINTLGVLYLVENGSSVQTVEDLRGKTIYAAGKGNTPEYALNFMLSSAGLTVGQDVFVEYKSEHSECVAAITGENGGIAMLPQPFVTTAMAANENIRIALDLTKEWENASGKTLITGVTVARKEFVQAHPEFVESFLKDYQNSVNYVNYNVSDAAKLVEKFDIVKAAVAEKAIPYCNITCLTGNEMKEKLSDYLTVLYEQNAAAVGGTLPDDAFYYGTTAE